NLLQDTKLESRRLAHDFAILNPASVAGQPRKLAPNRLAALAFGTSQGQNQLGCWRGVHGFYVESGDKRSRNGGGRRNASSNARSSAPSAWDYSGESGISREQTMPEVSGARVRESTGRTGEHTQGADGRDRGLRPDA